MGTLFTNTPIGGEQRPGNALEHLYGRRPYKMNADYSNDPNEITMQLDTQVSAIINYVGPDKDRPVVSNRSAKTNVVVGNGETLLIGGLILEDDSDITGKVPFLSNIPLIKRFFTIDTKSEQQRELLIFITPSIIG